MSTELNKMSKTELQEELLSLRRELFNLRMRKFVGQTVQTHNFKLIRRNIARALTFLHKA